jgi:opacity protein-like surface antigen
VKHIVTFLIAALIVAGASATAHAESDKPYLASLVIGYAHMSETTADIEVPGEQSTEVVKPGGGLVIGGGLYYRAMPKLAIGVEACWLNLGETGSNVGPEHKLSSIPVTAQVAYFVPTPHGVTPFVTVGGGSYHNRYDGTFEGLSATVTSNSFGFNFGGGLKLEIDEGLGLGIDIRYHMISDPTLEDSVALGDIRAEVDSWNMLTVAGRLFAF